MTKFHINAKGVPAPCKAIKGNCPFGGITGQDKSYDWDEEHTFNNFDDWVDNFVSSDNSQDNIMKNNFAPWDIEKYKKAKGKSAGVNFDLEKDEDLR